MKKIFLLFLLFFLCSCEKDKVIDVKHINSGYTSELFTTLQLDSENDYISGISQYGEELYVTVYERKNLTHKKYELDMKTREFTLVESKEDENSVSASQNQVYESIIIETDDFIIKSIFDYNENILSYYYVQNDKSILLVEDSLLSPIEMITNYFIKDNEIYIVLAKEETLTINKLEGNKLIEIERYNYNEDEFNLIRYSYKNGENVFLYKNKTQYKLIKGNTVAYYDLYLDDYQLSEFYYNEGNTLVYKKDNYVKLVIDDEIYDLGFHPDYIVKDEYILSTTWSDDFKGKVTHYYDRKTKDKYVFSEYLNFEKYRFYYNDNYYLINNVLDEEQTYSIMKIENKEVTVIDLPFSKDFTSSVCFDRAIMFYIQENDEIKFYLVKF